ncbi:MULTISPECIES: maleylpyruvate isomerase family mycothiol-dependent enzyme [Mycobacterium]|uniref:maleylpyruvate isomerase family mycothiol-dependent enzyme n=1 Tax=Mycobacterium TaxID=1763 RepID=UPI0009685FFA|nr:MULTISPECIES: maleylpyruvate isomerase family mycothiol-dependent enzyme [Mycobacterium]MCG7608725.1 maleylpyruvate isomerase family mycothiol-dependent enzyme [Mycobacterium sp. CnD-18-1]OLT97565.1 hypothetical protein BKG60_05765 [Mycobacterium syngnathidarum]
MSSSARPVTRLDKTDVLDGLFGEWGVLDGLVEGLSDEQWHAQTPLPGWTVRDVLAHVIGTESMLHGATAPDADTDVSPPAHVRNDIGALNELWVRQLSTVGTAELLEKFREVTAARRNELEQVSDTDWEAVTATPVGPDSYGRFMRVRIFDCWMHEHDIRDALRRPAQNPAGVPARLALDELLSSMGFVVGKLGGAPDGSRVRIELTGPLRRTVNVAIDGRGRLVESFDTEPTVTITLDGLLFTRLAGGRTTPDRHAAEVSYRGEEAVGRRIVDHLNFVI